MFDGTMSETPSQPRIATSRSRIQGSVSINRPAIPLNGGQAPSDSRRVSRPVRIIRMSPDRTVTPCAASAPSRSATEMPSPGSSQLTPLSRAISSNTPRVEMPSSRPMIEFRSAPVDSTSEAGKPLYILPWSRMWQSASICVLAIPCGEIMNPSPVASSPRSRP